MKNVVLVFLSILNLHLARKDHADFDASIFKMSLLFWMMISCLNCLPLPDHVPVELHWESWIEKENDICLHVLSSHLINLSL